MILKPSFYDEFHCIGGDCTFTCCMDWTIPLDREETARHLTADGEYNARPLVLNDDGTAKLRFREDGRCYFLNERGLCRLVLEHGEEFLNMTCHVFPRFEESYNNVCEKHLSNACPAVLDFFLGMRSPMAFIAQESDESSNALIDQIMLDLREAYIDLLQTIGLSLWVKLFILQKVSHGLVSEYDAEKAISLMRDDDYLIEVYRTVDAVPVSPKKSLLLLYQVIRDIGFYKKNLGAYRTYIKPYEDKLELLLDPKDEVLKKWDEFRNSFDHYQESFENFCVNYLFTHTMAITQASQNESVVKTLLLEYIMIRGVLFLCYLENGNISDTDVKNIAVFYARMYEHGLEGTGGFLSENLNNPWFMDPGLILMLK